MSLVIRADASVVAGTGHVMRCLALAQAWRDEVGAVCFITSIDSPGLERRLEREEMAVYPAARPAGGAEDASHTAEVARQTGARWVVVDGYHFPPSYRALLGRAGFRLLVVDDNGDRGPYDTDLVLNQNAHAHPGLYAERGSSTRLLLGTEYVLLRQEFLGAAPPRPEVAPSARRVLITMGGADAGNATLRVMEALSRLCDEGLECEVILGAVNPHRAVLEAESRGLRLPVGLVRDPADLADRMARADAAVSAGGATLWELCYFGVPTLAISLADNQRPPVAWLGAAGALLDGTTAWAESTAALAHAIGRLVADVRLRVSLSHAARRLVDGRGAARVVRALREGAGGGRMIRLRDLRPDDEPLLLGWRNLPEVARYMFTDHEITPEAHAAWFGGIAGDPQRRYWIIVCDGEDVGQINLYDVDVANSRCFWGFYLASPSMRGQGVGSFAWHSVLRHVFDDLGLNKLCSEVLGFNEQGIRLHARFGFQREGLFRQHVVKDGEPMDVVRLAILREEWERAREEIEARLRRQGVLSE